MPSPSHPLDDPRFRGRHRCDASIRLATWLSLAAVAFAVVAHIAHVPEQVVVLSVIVAGFVTSWVRSGSAGAAPAPCTVPNRTRRMRVGRPAGSRA